MSDKDKLFSADFFRSNRDRLRKTSEPQVPIVLTANAKLQKSRDEAYPFRQDSSFWYLTGLDESSFILVIDGQDEYFIEPDRSESYKHFHGGTDNAQIHNLTGVKEVYAHDKGWEKLKAMLKSSTHVATLGPMPEYVEELELYSNPSRKMLIEKLRSIHQDMELINLRENLTQLRAIKKPEEIKAIETAVSETAKLYDYISGNYKSYKTERELYLDASMYVLKHGLEFAYGPVIANGKNAATLHYDKYLSAINPKLPTLLDLGIKYQNYCSDITRTICMDPSKRHQEVYREVLAVQDYCRSQLKPGVTLRQFENLVREAMSESLDRLGLAKSGSDVALNKYYPHATSHFIGLDAHDPGDPEASLEAGMVVTIEPGIYIPEESLGIRVEDTVLLTSSGNRVLSANLSRTLSSAKISK